MKGLFKPTRPERYSGDARQIVYRSSYELKYMRFLDSSPEIERWSSEEVVVPYVSPKDGRVHRYFVDFWVLRKDGQEAIIEIKPMVECRPPKQPKSPRGKNKYVAEVMTYAVNQKKWEAASAYARERGIEFLVLTERELDIPIRRTRRARKSASKAPRREVLV